MSIFGMIVAVLFFIVGIAGTVLPVLPGAPLIWLGMLLYGLIVDFNNLPWTFFLGQGLAVALIFFVDYIAGVWGVSRYGGSKEAVWGSVIGALLGLFLMGPFGLIFGPFLGAVAGELYVNNTLEKAFRVGVGTLVGLLGGFVIKLAIEIVMIVWFFMAVL
ncbi:MAG: DUF456 family protein [Desulfotomaculaceae bacterium]|nr:DUF456 family protein [Desulfotomaculaceae bacterium]MDD4766630.1 DUF456 family protein [Desulfotomaculaceae bacterium]